MTNVGTDINGIGSHKTDPCLIEVNLHENRLEHENVCLRQVVA